MDFQMDIRLLGPMATLCGIGVSIFLWNLNQRRKSISYRILWRHPLLNLKGVAREQLDIRFKGENVSTAQLLIVSVFNSGHLPVNLGDYQPGLSIRLNPGATILDAHIIETMPADLEERLKDPGASLVEKIDQERVMIRPVLLNEGDAFTVQLLVLNATEGITLTGHVNGVKRIVEWRENRILAKSLTQFGAFVMALAMLAVQPSDLLSLRMEPVLPYLLTFLIGYVLLSAGLNWPSKNQGSIV
jgi:hypothetical protein